MATPELRRLVKEAVDSTRINLDDLSRLTGCSVFSLRAYRLGYRMPSATTRARIASGLRDHAEAVLLIAEDLESDKWQS